MRGSQSGAAAPSDEDETHLSEHTYEHPLRPMLMMTHALAKLCAGQPEEMNSLIGLLTSVVQSAQSDTELQLHAIATLMSDFYHIPLLFMFPFSFT